MEFKNVSKDCSALENSSSAATVVTTRNSNVHRTCFKNNLVSKLSASMVNQNNVLKEKKKVAKEFKNWKTNLTGVLEQKKNTEKKVLKTKLKELQLENNNLIAELEGKTKNINTIRNNKIYDIPIRKFIYRCLLNHVSVETPATVIETKEMTRIYIQSLPSTITISHIGL